MISTALIEFDVIDCKNTYHKVDVAMSNVEYPEIIILNKNVKGWIDYFAVMYSRTLNKRKLFSLNCRAHIFKLHNDRREL